MQIHMRNATEDQPVGDLQSTIHDIQIENERLFKELHQVTILKEHLKLEVEELTHRISVPQARVFTIDKVGKEGENISYWHSDDSATVNNQRCDEAPKQADQDN